MTPHPAYVRIAPGETLPDMAGHAPFRAVVVIDASCSNEWQNQVSDWLVASGCLYMMAWGPDCSSWDDSVDWAAIEYHGDAEPTDDNFVMTTWHDTETLDEVFWFATFCAKHPTKATEPVIVHVSAEDDREQMIARYVAAAEA